MATMKTVYNPRMRDSTRSYFDRERSNRPAYAGTSYEEHRDLERSLGSEGTTMREKSQGTKEIAKLIAQQRNDDKRDKRDDKQ